MSTYSVTNHLPATGIISHGIQSAKQHKGQQSRGSQQSNTLITRVLPCNRRCHAQSWNWLTPSRFPYCSVVWRPKQGFDLHHCSGRYLNMQMTSFNSMVLLELFLSHTKSNAFMDNTHLCIVLNVDARYSNIFSSVVAPHYKRTWLKEKMLIAIIVPFIY